VIERRKICDTSQPGRANLGPLFRDDLTEEERLGVIESLKALSGGGRRHQRGLARCPPHDYWEEPWTDAACARTHAKASDPVQPAKIAAAKRGKPRPPHVGKAVAEAHRGTHPSAEARRKMSEAHRLRGTRPPRAGRPWTAEEDELLRTRRPKDVARVTGRTLTAVNSRRVALRLEDGRTRAARGRHGDALPGRRREL